MRIVTRAELMRMPIGTVFQEYEPCVFYELRIKTETVEDFDFRSVTISADSFDADSSEEHDMVLQRAEITGEDIPLDFSDAQDFRDGLFDDEQLYAVWSTQDVRALIARLEETLALQVKEDNPS